MKLYTTVDIPASPYRITYEKQGLWLGSCFADRMGGLMSGFKFPVTVNPFGVLYNPASIVRSLLRMEHGTRPKPEELLFDGGMFCSLDFHSSFSGIEREDVLRRMSDAVIRGHRALMSADYLVLTLGTPVVYRYLPTGEIVCNCHKISARQFTRERLTAGEIVALFATLFDREPYCRKRILFTVSPVRHIRDGMADNFLNKAVLRVAIAELMRMYPFVDYFPVYEIMNDELRDYRFYEVDMLHPSAQAVQYIWQRFTETYIPDETRKIFSELERIAAAVRHRPLHPDSATYRKFRKTVGERVRKVSEKYPFLDLTEELRFFDLGSK